MAMRKSDNRAHDDESLDSVLLDESFWSEFADMFPEVNILTYEEAMNNLDVSAMHYFGIGANEFIRRWDAHDFSEDDYEIASMLSWTIPATSPE
jgi:hypothetical protein